MTTKKLLQKNISKFMDFNVYSFENNSSFFHVNIEDTPVFYNLLFDFFFDDNKILGIAENKSNLKFHPSKKNYVTLYRHLSKYLDDFNQIRTFDELDSELLKILSEEYIIENTADGKYIVRLDKIGKIGEYIFSVLLSEYFSFDCIIPKIHLVTNPNMNVYGVDVLFYSSKDSMILFGESKFSKSLNNGIKLVKKSLLDYEQQLRKEYELVLTNRILKTHLNFFNDIYGEIAECSIDIEQFIFDAKISKIGIPIFIAHGTEEQVDEILLCLSTIERNNFFGLETVYYAISLPLINKDKAIAVFTSRIKQKLEDYRVGSKAI